MTQMPLQCQNLEKHIKDLLNLLDSETSVRSQHDNTVNQVQASLRQATSSEFEIVFAGPYSAGKSMMINALLERYLLYSGEGHATGTECRIMYAEARDQEQAVLTFLSASEVKDKVDELCQYLRSNLPSANLTPNIELDNDMTITNVKKRAEEIIQEEGGSAASEKARQALALKLLLEGWMGNREKIKSDSNPPLDLQAAAEYACRGANGAVVKQIEYYCHHSLLQGNVLVDLPGINAPVAADVEKAFDKVRHDKTAAVVCMLGAATDVEISAEETRLREIIRNNPGIRDRVFWVFNRVDNVWSSNNEFKQKYKQTKSEFNNERRVFETSALLGFYAPLVQQANQQNRFGLDSIFINEEKADGSKFVRAFLAYCQYVYLPKHPSIKFEIKGQPEDTYVQILSSEHGSSILEELITDSRIKDFRKAIIHYLTKEKQPQLFAALADDLRLVCASLIPHYTQKNKELQSEPGDIEALKKYLEAQELEQLAKALIQIGKDFEENIRQEVKQVAENKCDEFKSNFEQLQKQVSSHVQKFIAELQLKEVYNQAASDDSLYSVTPRIDIFSESFHRVVRQLEKVGSPTEVMMRCRRE